MDLEPDNIDDKQFLFCKEKVKEEIRKTKSINPNKKLL